MRFFNFIIVIIIGLFSLTSCESTLDSSDSLNDPHMVVYSLFAPDSLWKVYVTKTQSIFSELQEIILDEAEVNVTDLTNNQSLVFDYNPDGYFSTNQKPIEGHVYYITVSHNDYGIIKATNSVPSIEQLSVSSSVYSNNEESFVNIEITPNSEEAKALYYAWEIVELEDVELDSTGLIIEGGNEVKSLVQLREFDNDGLSFVGGSDFSNTGSIKDSLQSALLKRFFIDGESEVSPDTKIAVKLIAISNDMYHYYNSLANLSNQAQSTNTNKVEIHSNVIDGFGIFAGYKEKYIILN